MGYAQPSGQRSMGADAAFGMGARLRGSNWLKLSRFTCGYVLTFIIGASAASGGSGGTSISVQGVGATLALVGVVAVLWEWRARKLGVRLTEDGIDLIRVVDTVHIRWSEIACFAGRDAGTGLWGDKTLRVRRKRVAGVANRIGVSTKLPTLAIIGQGNPIGRWLGPCDLVVGETRVPQDHVLSFLNEKLARHSDLPFSS